MHIYFFIDFEHHICVVSDSDAKIEECLKSFETSDGKDGYSVSGARKYRLNPLKDGEVKFMSQAEDYAHRGIHFEQFSFLEYFCAVELRRNIESDKPSAKVGGAGRPASYGFELGEGHKLNGHYRGFLKSKSSTPVLSGVMSS
jgi:hypothetical protein